MKSLEPELLTDENRYACEQCKGLRDASRYTEIVQLPPVCIPQSPTSAAMEPVDRGTKRFLCRFYTFHSCALCTISKPTSVKSPLPPSPFQSQLTCPSLWREVRGPNGTTSEVFSSTRERVHIMVISKRLHIAYSVCCPRLIVTRSVAQIRDAK